MLVLLQKKFLSLFRILKPLGVNIIIQENNIAYRCELCKGNHWRNFRENQSRPNWKLISDSGNISPIPPHLCHCSCGSSSGEAIHAATMSSHKAVPGFTPVVKLMEIGFRRCIDFDLFYIARGFVLRCPLYWKLALADTEVTEILIMTVPFLTSSSACSREFL